MRNAQPVQPAAGRDNRTGNPGTFASFGRQARRAMWMAVLVLTLGAGVPAGVRAEAPSSAVPFTQALTDAERVAKMNRGWGVMEVKGGSMEPEFGNASLLLVAHAGFDELQPGMVVVYRDQAGDLVAHKVLQATAGGWIVKGLNNDRADPGLVTAENLRGVVFGILNYDPESTKLAAADQPTVAYAKQY